MTKSKNATDLAANEKVLYFC